MPTVQSGKSFISFLIKIIEDALKKTKCFQLKQTRLCFSFLFRIFSFHCKEHLGPLLIDPHQVQKIKDGTRWCWWARDQLVACSSKRSSVNLININSFWCEANNQLLFKKILHCRSKLSNSFCFVLFFSFTTFSFCFIWFSLRYSGPVRSWVYFNIKVLVHFLMKQKQRS